MTNKKQIKPGLIEALGHFGTLPMAFDDYNMPSSFVYVDDKGHKSEWSVEQACRQASEILTGEDLAKFQLAAIRKWFIKRNIYANYAKMMRDINGK